MTKLFTGTIVGGPNDGLYLDYETEERLDDIALDKLKTNRVILESHGHAYRVVGFDESRQTCVLIYESALVP